MHSTLHHLATHDPLHGWHMWSLSSYLCNDSSFKNILCCRQAEQKSIQHFCHDWLASISIITGQRAFTAPAGAHRKHSCRPCNKAVAGQDAKNIFWDGHPRWLYLVAHGKDSLLTEHIKKDAEKYKIDLLQAKVEHLLESSARLKHSQGMQPSVQGMGT